LDWVRDETNRDRLAAWNLSLAAWRSAPLWGTGLGTTGAAALRTDPAQSFVTESQVLKALVELGLPGLLTLGYLWFEIGRAVHRVYRAHRRQDDPLGRPLLLGVAIGLLVVFIEGWVYQNLEVKQVNAYFWTLVGLLAFLNRGRKMAADE
jgi:O-antigen ligase